jgi:hypothetical protein
VSSFLVSAFDVLAEINPTQSFGKLPTGRYSTFGAKKVSEQIRALAAHPPTGANHPDLSRPIISMGATGRRYPAGAGLNCPIWAPEGA